MTTFSMTLHGPQQLARRLDDFEGKVRRKIITKAVRAGVGPFVRSAKANSPRGNGYFRRSLTSVVRSYQSGAVKMGIIGQLKHKRITAKKIKRRGGISGRGDVVPIHFVEENTRPHKITAKGGALAIRTPGGRVRIARSANHPGTRGQHPIRKAAQQSERQGLDAFQRKLAAEIDAEAAKMEATL